MVMHSDGIIILSFVIGALLLGAVIKSIFQNAKLPYSVILLLAGIAFALLDKSGWVSTWVIGELFHQIIHQVGAVDPHLILFLFLPVLIFESAYAMEPHLFFRIAPQIVLLAVLGLVISMVLTAFAASLLFSWSLGVALLFGALICATDPVAVVSLLKEKSSRKRLETLIEGESLLNDGTAIVFFSLFYGFAAGSTTEINSWLVVRDFLWIVIAGTFIGAIVGMCVLGVIGRLLNQPLMEITLSVVAAYIAFIISEQFHVSGVVSLVVLGLMFSTVGRTRISPEITHFLHQFWEMMAYLANTLIFLIVGIVIALHISVDDSALWLKLIALYLLLLFIRSASVIMLMPILKRIGVGITREKATVLVWAGLRGAVSLALALSLAQDPAVPKALGEQILFLTAGIVVLTIVINGSTMEWLLHLLGLDKLPPAKEASVQKAAAGLQVQMEAFLAIFRGNVFFNNLSPDELRSYIGEAKKVETSPSLLNEDVNEAFMRRLLEIERRSYWQQVENGYIGQIASKALSDSVEIALDDTPLIAPRKGLDKYFSYPSPPSWMTHIPLFSRYLDTWIFNRVSLCYDVARGFMEAQEEMKKHIAKLAPSSDAKMEAENLIDNNRQVAFEFAKLIEIEYASSIASLQLNSAQRLILNHERSLIWKMQREGVLEDSEAQKLVEIIEEKMKQKL
jgi:NhaP-type Na+/H+ or K+/H+ antiporter